MFWDHFGQVRGEAIRIWEDIRTRDTKLDILVSLTVNLIQPRITQESQLRVAQEILANGYILGELS